MTESVELSELEGTAAGAPAVEKDALPACATRAEGVVETFLAIVERVLARAPGVGDRQAALRVVAGVFSKPTALL